MDFYCGYMVLTHLKTFFLFSVYCCWSASLWLPITQERPRLQRDDLLEEREMPSPRFDLFFRLILDINPNSGKMEIRKTICCEHLSQAENQKGKQYRVNCFVCVRVSYDYLWYSPAQYLSLSSAVCSHTLGLVTFNSEMEHPHIYSNP